MKISSKISASRSAFQLRRGEGAVKAHEKAGQIYSDLGYNVIYMLDPAERGFISGLWLRMAAPIPRLAVDSLPWRHGWKRLLCRIL
jgi:hypothetical protein